MESILNYWDRNTNKHQEKGDKPWFKDILIMNIKNNLERRL